MGYHRGKLDWPVITGVVGVFVVGRKNPNGSGLHDVCPVRPDVHRALFGVDLKSSGVGKQLSIDPDPFLADFNRVAGSGGDRLKQGRVLVGTLEAAGPIAACNCFGCSGPRRAKSDKGRVRVIGDDVEACTN